MSKVINIDELMGRDDAKASTSWDESRLSRMAVTAIERVTIAEHPYSLHSE